MIKKTIGVVLLAASATFAQTPEFDPALSKNYALGQGWALGKVVPLDGGGYRAYRSPSPFPPGTVLASMLERGPNKDVWNQTVGYRQVRASLIVRSITPSEQVVGLALVCETYNREDGESEAVESRTHNTESIELKLNVLKQIGLSCMPYGQSGRYDFTLKSITPKGAEIEIK